jgi:hypothetical protein
MRLTKKHVGMQAALDFGRPGRAIPMGCVGW